MRKIEGTFRPSWSARRTGVGQDAQQGAKRGGGVAGGGGGSIRPGVSKVAGDVDERESRHSAETAVSQDHVTLAPEGSSNDDKLIVAKIFGPIFQVSLFFRSVISSLRCHYLQSFQPQDAIDFLGPLSEAFASLPAQLNTPPSPLPPSDVVLASDALQAAGGLGGVYKGTYQGTQVALKHLRCFLLAKSSPQERIQVFVPISPFYDGSLYIVVSGVRVRSCCVVEFSPFLHRTTTRHHNSCRLRWLLHGLSVDGAREPLNIPGYDRFLFHELRAQGQPPGS